MIETELVARLECLERDNRRLKTAGAAALVLAAALGAIYATAPTPAVIEAHAFEVIDAAGAVRVEVKPGEVRFFDGQGVPRAGLGISSGYPLLFLRGKSGTISLDTLSPSVMPGIPSGMPGIWLLDAAGKMRMAMQLVGEGSVISLHATQGVSHVTLDEFPDGPLVSLADAQGFGLDLGSSRTVTPTTGATQRTSAASILMFGNDKARHVIWQAP
jgi:hypothetical protein